MRFLRLIWASLIITGSLAISVVPAIAVEPGGGVFDRTWSRTDLPVAAEQTVRTWMWGPSAFTSAMEEPYIQGVGGVRVVQYFDKTRMEITAESGIDPGSIWYVTNGLLAKELVTGDMQLGDNDFQSREPALNTVAGDADDANGPIYASFTGVLDAEPLAPGTPITHQIQRDGRVTTNPDLAGQNVTAAQLITETNHTVAAPFWEFMTSSGTIYENGIYVDGLLFQNPFFATGLPISEAYWADVKLAGVQQLVLIQVFERRVLTYTPNNPAEWQVEAGNVGQHYYRWRYLTDLPAEPPTVDLANYHDIGPSFLIESSADIDGQAMISINNQAPFELVVQLDGPVSRTLAIPACPDCQIYDPQMPPSTCGPEVPRHDEVLPPGNYRVQVSWVGAASTPLAGPQTYVPDAMYGTCFYILAGT